MSDIENRARDLLAALTKIRDSTFRDAAALRGIADLAINADKAGDYKATSSDGFVLVPVGAEKDAERYQYIRWIAAGDPVEFGIIEDAAFSAHYGDAAQFDLNIDGLIAARPEVPDA